MRNLGDCCAPAYCNCGWRGFYFAALCTLSGMLVMPTHHTGKVR